MTVDNHPDRAGAAEVREWAMTKKAGAGLSARGNLPRYVILAWNKAHPDRPYDSRAFRHGHSTEGLIHHCECEACRKAHSSMTTENYMRRVERGLASDDPRHGTPTGYDGWGCRCDRCKAANHNRRVRQGIIRE